MRAVINFLTAHKKYIIIFYSTVQLVYIFFFQAPFKSDSFYYYKLALSSLNSGFVYPSEIHLHEDYIIAPLFVNIQSFILSVYNSQYTVGLFHLFLNLIQLFILFAITKKYYGEKAAAVFTLMYILYLPNMGFILLNMTELLFGVFVALTLYFLLKEKNSFFTISGLFAAASVSVRPLGWALIISILVYLMVVYRKERLRSLISFTSGILAFFIIIGSATYISSGQFIITSVNYGTNFLIGANDDATGAYNDKVFKEGKKGFVDNPEKMTYIEKQSYWFNQAVEWIKEKPFDWLKIFPLKLVHIYAWDDYAISPLLWMQDWNLYKLIKSLLITKNIDQFFNQVPLFTQIAYISLQIMHHIYYFIIILIFFLMIFKNYSSLKNDRIFKLLLLIIGFSVLIPLISFGDPRFKYPYILYMMIIISPFINSFFQKLNVKSKNIYA